MFWFHSARARSADSPQLVEPSLSPPADPSCSCIVTVPSGQGSLDYFERRQMASLVNGPWNLNRLADPSSPAYNDVRVSAEVKANDNSPALTKVAMEPNPSSRPFVESYVFKGFMDCSATAVIEAS